MTTQAPTPKAIKKTIYRCTEAEYHRHVNDSDGLCLACGGWTCGGVEPDARRYPCELCDMEKVYGAEEVLLMGRLLVTHFGKDEG